MQSIVTGRRNGGSLDGGRLHEAILLWLGRIDDAILSSEGSAGGFGDRKGMNKELNVKGNKESGTKDLAVITSKPLVCFQLATSTVRPPSASTEPKPRVDRCRAVLFPQATPERATRSKSRHESEEALLS